MSEFGNGITMAIEALQDDFDLVDVFWCAARKPRGWME
jgi:hypothetical protein